MVARPQIPHGMKNAKLHLFEGNYHGDGNEVPSLPARQSVSAHPRRKFLPIRRGLWCLQVWVSASLKRSGQHITVASSVFGQNSIKMRLISASSNGEFGNCTAFLEGFH